jgi:hypothetical protein
MVEAWARTVAATGDERHLPEETVLYTALQAHWKTFVSELEAAAEPLVLPAFVVAEVEALRCGILSQGLMLAKFRDCGWCGPVAFSCRRRGFWLSCLGRRMSDFTKAPSTSAITSTFTPPRLHPPSCR